MLKPLILHQGGQMPRNSLWDWRTPSPQLILRDFFDLPPSLLIRLSTFILPPTSFLPDFSFFRCGTGWHVVVTAALANLLFNSRGGFHHLQ